MRSSLATAPVNYAPANSVQLAPGQTSVSANRGTVNYAAAQYAPFQYAPVPNANANYAPVAASSSQFTPATPVGPAAPVVPPVQSYAPNGYVPAQSVGPGYGIFQQPAPQGDPRGNAVVPPNPTNGGAF